MDASSVVQCESRSFSPQVVEVLREAVRLDSVQITKSFVEKLIATIDDREAEVERWVENFKRGTMLV